MDDVLSALRNAQRRVERIQHDLDQVGLDLSIADHSIKEAQFSSNEIYEALLELSESLASSYAQARRDIEDKTRLTWAGAAHELREVLRGMLELLAPDNQVMEQSWFRQEAPKGASHKQRALHVLMQRAAGSREKDVVERIDVLDEMVAGLVRDTYSRASDSAHGSKGRKEARRLLHYFDAFAHDLLDL